VASEDIDSRFGRSEAADDDEVEGGSKADMLAWALAIASEAAMPTLLGLVEAAKWLR
jgi:hypothetical protein